MSTGVKDHTRGEGVGRLVGLTIDGREESLFECMDIKETESNFSCMSTINSSIKIAGKKIDSDYFRKIKISIGK